MIWDDLGAYTECMLHKTLPPNQIRIGTLTHTILKYIDRIPGREDIRAGKTYNYTLVAL